MTMDEKTCIKCNHLCHCIEADHVGCECANCECSGKEYFKHRDTKDEGVVVDSTKIASRVNNEYNYTKNRAVAL